MFSKNFLLPALAATTVLAQRDDGCSNEATTTIENQQQASALATCTTYSGSIAVATGLGGDITFPGIEEITGDLTVESNDLLASLGANELETIGGSFHLNGATALQTLNFPSLTSVKTILWESNAILNTLNAGSIITESESVTVRDSQLRTLTGINLMSAATLILANNAYLQNITLQVTNVTDTLSIANNADSTSVSLPNLVGGGLMEFYSISALDIQSLEMVTGGLSIQESPNLESISAANLTNVGFLTIIKNENLANISFPALSDASQDLRISANDKLTDVDFPALKMVGGALDIAGSIEDVKLDVIEHVDGVFNIQSVADISSLCTTFKGMEGAGKEFTKVDCKSDTDNPTDSNGNDAGGVNGNGNGGGSGGEGAASRVGLSAFLGLTGFAMYLLL